MKQDIKELHEKVIPVLKNNKEIYDMPFGRLRIRDENRFTVLSLWELASNHLFDDGHHLFSITENEGWKIRHYFENPNSREYNYSFEYQRAVEDMIVDMYKTFPGVFEGESRDYLKVNRDLSRLIGVPFF
jgi:hypothetical protein